LFTFLWVGVLGGAGSHGYAGHTWAVYSALR
jgi:hypothetical protein